LGWVLEEEEEEERGLILGCMWNDLLFECTMDIRTSVLLGEREKLSVEWDIEERIILHAFCNAQLNLVLR
jgi:hypothetical protein